MTGSKRSSSTKSGDLHKVSEDQINKKTVSTVPASPSKRITRASLGITLPKRPFDTSRKSMSSSEESSPTKLSDSLSERENEAKKRSTKSPPKLTGDHDVFCWMCHKDGGVTIECRICPRIYHKRCSKLESLPTSPWVCIECKNLMRAESVDTRSRAMKMINIKKLNYLLKFAMERLTSSPSSEPFKSAVDLKEYPNYLDYIINPMDLSKVEKNLFDLKYHSTEAFISDIKWIVHNSYIFNSTHSELTTMAKSLVKMSKSECEEIESCPSCYEHANTMDDDDWFIEPCDNPHILIWAKLRGWPFWPGKIVKSCDGMADVRFFGDHNRSNVPYELCHLLSASPPHSGFTGRQKTQGYEESIVEVKEHIKKLKEKFGAFSYFPMNQKYRPADHEKLLAEMIPKEKAVEKIEESKQLKRPSEDNTLVEVKRARLSANKVSSTCSLGSDISSDSVDSQELPVIEAVMSLNEGDSNLSFVSRNNSLLQSTNEEKETVEKVESISDPGTSVENNTDKISNKPLLSSSSVGLKLKCEEELLTPAALTLRISQNSSGESPDSLLMEESQNQYSENELNHVDEIIENVIKGNFSVVLPSRSLIHPARRNSLESPHLSSGSTLSSDDEKSHEAEEVKEVVGKEEVPGFAGNCKNEKYDFPFSIMKVSRNDTHSDYIKDISAWGHQKFEDNSVIMEAMDEVLKSIPKDVTPDMKDALNKIKSLMAMQRQEMVELYGKIKREAAELTDVLDVEIEQLNLERLEFNNEVKKLKLTQWCALCLKEANFYCCWGTSYCGIVCQKRDWANHYEHCHQNEPGGGTKLESLEKVNCPIGSPTQNDSKESTNVVNKFSTPKAGSNSLSGKRILLTSVNTLQNPNFKLIQPKPADHKEKIPEKVMKVLLKPSSSNMLPLAQEKVTKVGGKSVVIAQTSQIGNKYFIIKSHNNVNASSTSAALPIKLPTQPIKIISPSAKQIT